MESMPVTLRVILIFLMVAILAGGIAMLGNQLGRKIGRRKMTVFGMRPRHTSIFITTITGSLIALLTLGAAMLGSKDVYEYVTGTRERVEKLERRERQLLERLSQLADEVRRGTIIWNHGERIALNTVKPGMSEAETTRLLGGLLVESNMISLLKNNEIALNRKTELFDPDTVLLEYSAEDFANWVRRYSHLKEAVGVQTVVRQNCFFQDKIPVSIESFPVKIIYKEGQVVLSKDISVENMLNDWYDFVSELKEAALHNGMIEINSSLGGGVTEETLEKISRTATTFGGRVRLRAKAKRPLYQSSKLDVQIEVEPLK